MIGYLVLHGTGPEQHFVGLSINHLTHLGCMSATKLISNEA
jgi:hypothetical protein